MIVSVIVILIDVHRLWYLEPRTLFAKGLNEMPRGFQVSHPFFDDMILLVNMSNFFR